MLRRSKRWALMAICSMPLLGNGMTDDDRTRLVRHLEDTDKGFVEALQGLTEEQLNFRPSPEAWTVFECAEHITVSEDNMFEEFEKVFMTLTPAPGVKSATPDDKVLEYGTNRQYMRMKAAETYRPVGRWSTAPEMLDRFRTSRRRTLDLARTTGEDLRGRYYEKFQLDAYQYLLILSAHTQRHTLQIKEIMAAPGFPK